MEKSKFSELEKNTVESANQLKDSPHIRFHNASGGGARVIFMGNSITLHGRKPDIGWNNEWGMAASAEEKDYVHILMRKFREKDPQTAFCVCQVAVWERGYKEGGSLYDMYEDARSFGADIIIARFVENCQSKDFDYEAFEREYEKFLDYININGNARVILTTSFWPHPADEIIRKLGQKKGYPCITLGDLGPDDTMKAIGKFEHDGVANHPGDKGMKTIAERIWEAL